MIGKTSKMTKTLEKAVSLYTAVKHLKSHDCTNFINHLNDEGVEILCRIIHYVLNGELKLSKHIRGRLRNKIKNYLSDFKRLANYPRSQTDIRKKRKVLQKGGVVGVLTAIASAVVPLITQLLLSK